MYMSVSMSMSMGLTFYMPNLSVKIELRIISPWPVSTNSVINSQELRALIFMVMRYMRMARVSVAWQHIYSFHSVIGLELL